MARARLVDVAREANVSPGAVWRALSNDPTLSIAPDTRQRIVEAARQLRYVPQASARQLRSRKSTLVGILMNDVSGVFESALFAAISRGLVKLQREVLLGVSMGDAALAKHHLAMFRAYQTCAVLTLSQTGSPSDEIADEIENSAGELGPWLTVCFRGQVNHAPAFSMDVPWVYARAMEVFRERGYRTIRVDVRRGAIGADTDQEAISAAAAHAPDLRVIVSDAVTGDSGVQEGVDSLRALLADSPGERVGLLTWSDREAARLAQALCRAGIAVPDRVGILGFGNTETAAFSVPAVSTFDVMGLVPTLAGDVLAMLGVLLDGERPAAGVRTYRPSVVFRDTLAQ